MYVTLRQLGGVAKLRMLVIINRFEQQLDWHGANPKQIPFEDLVKHVRESSSLDGVENKYRARVKNRATAIRAYCIWCQGGSTSAVAGVRECLDVICPMHPFRMGKDPLRGWELPKAAAPKDDEEEFDDNFEEGDDGDERDAK